MLTDDDRDLMRAVSTYIHRVNELTSREMRPARTPLGDLISEHLGTDAAQVPVVQEHIADHRLVDADLALDALAAAGEGRLIGITGGDQRHHQGLAEFASNGHLMYAPGPVDYAERATGPDSSRRVVSLGIRLLHFEGSPVVLTQRAAAEQYGRPTAVIEVMGVDADVVTRFLDALRKAMVERSVLRGQVLSFQPTEYGRDAGATFVSRPSVAADEIVLPDGVLDEIVQHVVTIGAHREMLQRAGQHLKRGVLLYGPPGTGKTLTVRHLLSSTPGTTAVVLTGSSIRFISAAAEIARTFQPAIVVLEDIDLVAMERHSSPQPLLFEVLDALDGLDGDADVAFVMTTNRVDVLERALAERPGRVDLAVEVPLPELPERRRLFRRYAGALPYSDAALDAAAASAEGTTGSFAKELMRRSVLRAAEEGRDPHDEDLAAELARIMDSRERLTRTMLGSAADGSAPAP
ncbi:AAA family ATPase [Microbacterium sp. M3]|uniref:AAA family ATPase n=1 Tax=Microbacterium arthrosphaerae TaxID=792652 RepID=A0ABU4H519_9MICO|nr:MULTISPECIES: AAA family ATPase [Microbacterium]MDW4574435.1 AAA family ATPase [Microbacterium arthrosphaerae]MDW7608290.1 AAA family ATPase [Microbacterium sp. M3]